MKIKINEKEEIVKKVFSDHIDEKTEETLNIVQKKLQKINIISEIKRMIITFIFWLFNILIGLLFLHFVYKFDNDGIVNVYSLKLIKGLDIYSILKTYVSLAITSIISFCFIALVVHNNRFRNYEKKRKTIKYFRNTSYIYFIVVFCLTAFTVDQLDLVSIIISLVLLFKIVFEEDKSLSEKNLEKLIKKTVLDDMSRKIKCNDKKRKI